ncbi:Dopamine beta hydroxylase-related protein, containing doMON domain [Thermococcus sp. 2319x1]|uniref:DOMON domain-containing protein n=1 Tax=Thermococcus sp. 2319x1 TaxID=1674923 RepID=UPI00073AD5A8|nr:DOMON domain-containing protein [Thermococcus sp. 2319x1]ALV63689.1 Dopamine beta hydroxylase-related protein, containing doMON domain [Thermococcus sp. 2319x1]
MKDLKKLGFVVLFLVGIVLLSGCTGGNGSPSTTQTAQSGTPIQLGEWRANGIIDENEYAHELSLAGGKLTVYWRNDGTYLYMALKGQTSGWVAIGFEPTDKMKDADMVFGWVQDGNTVVIDAYSTGTYGPHPPDEKLGGSSDILEYAGKEENGVTIIEFKRKLNTGDQYDKAFTPGQKISFIFALADVDDFTTKHNIARGYGELQLDG